MLDIGNIYRSMRTEPIYRQSQLKIALSVLFLILATLPGYLIASSIKSSSPILFTLVALSILVCLGLIAIILMILNDRIGDIARSNAKVSPVGVAYKQITAAIKNAQHEVLVFTHFTYDKETGERHVDPARMNSPLRRELFAAFEGAILDSKISYTRIFQVDATNRKKAEEIVGIDKFYKHECDAFSRAKNSTNSRLLFCAPVTTLTFILVDSVDVFFDVEINHHADDDIRPSFTIYVSGADPELVRNLRQIADKAVPLD